MKFMPEKDTREYEYCCKCEFVCIVIYRRYVKEQIKLIYKCAVNFAAELRIVSTATRVVASSYRSYAVHRSIYS